MSEIVDPRSIIVSAACDDAYAMPCAVMLFSLLENLSSDATVRIEMIDAGTTHAVRDKIASVVGRCAPRAVLRWHRPDLRDFRPLPLPDLVKRAMCPRLLLAEVLPETCHRALYLDSDLVVETDVRRLWNEELGDRALLAVRDFGHPTIASGLTETYRTCGLDGELPYFNSGVLLLNLHRWRRDAVGERAVQYMQRFAALCRYPDQDPLNAATAGNIGLLDPRWNAQVAAIQTHADWPSSAFKQEIVPLLDALRNTPYVRHFVGPTKPWHLGHHVLGRSRFLHYLRNSGWFTTSEWMRWITQWRWRSATLNTALALKRRAPFLARLVGRRR